MRVMVNHQLKHGMPLLFKLRKFYLVLRVVTFIYLWLMAFNSLDTLDRACMTVHWGRLGLPLSLRRVYFAHHANLGIRFKLARGNESPWTRDGVIPQGCPLSMILIVALYVPCCRFLESRINPLPHHFMRTSRRALLITRRAPHCCPENCSIGLYGWPRWSLLGNVPSQAIVNLLDVR